MTVHSLDLVDWAPPDVHVRVSVSTGTYIRALARDLGDFLGCGAHLRSLRRTSIGPFEVGAAASPETAVTADRPAGAWREGADAIPWMPVRTLEEAEIVFVSTGQPVERGTLAPAVANSPDADPRRVSLVHGGSLIAVGREDGDLILPEKVFHAA